MFTGDYSKYFNNYEKGKRRTGGIQEYLLSILKIYH